LLGPTGAAPIAPRKGWENSVCGAAGTCAGAVDLNLEIDRTLLGEMTALLRARRRRAWEDLGAAAPGRPIDQMASPAGSI